MRVAGPASALGQETVGGCRGVRWGGECGMGAGERWKGLCRGCREVEEGRWGGRGRRTVRLMEGAGGPRVRRRSVGDLPGRRGQAAVEVYDFGVSADAVGAEVHEPEPLEGGRPAQGHVRLPVLEHAVHRDLGLRDRDECSTRGLPPERPPPPPSRLLNAEYDTRLLQHQQPAATSACRRLSATHRRSNRRQIESCHRQYPREKIAISKGPPRVARHSRTLIICIRLPPATQPSVVRSHVAGQAPWALSRGLPNGFAAVPRFVRVSGRRWPAPADEPQRAGASVAHDDDDDDDDDDCEGFLGTC